MAGVHKLAAAINKKTSSYVCIMKHIILTTLLLVFGFTLNAQNPIQFRSEHSELVIEGRVMECRSFWNESRTQILTSNIVQVFKVFKGKDFNKETIEIITLGGTVGDRFSIVSHQKTFKPGMEGVFFCNTNRKLSSMQQADEVSFVLSFSETTKNNSFSTIIIKR